MRKYHRKVPKMQHKALRIVCAIICIIVLISFIVGLVLGILGGHNYDLYLMKFGIWTCVISGIVMGMLHILYFRTSKKFRKKLFGDQYENFKDVK